MTTMLGRHLAFGVMGALDTIFSLRCIAEFSQASTFWLVYDNIGRVAILE
jgi:hypothetical protein